MQIVNLFINCFIFLTLVWIVLKWGRLLCFKSVLFVSNWSILGIKVVNLVLKEDFLRWWAFDENLNLGLWLLFLWYIFRGALARFEGYLRARETEMAFVLLLKHALIYDTFILNPTLLVILKVISMRTFRDQDLKVCHCWPF